MFYVLLVKDHGQVRTAAFTIPNRPEKQDYRDYAVSVADMKKASGLNFFPQLGNHPPAEQEKGSWILAPIDCRLILHRCAAVTAVVSRLMKKTLESKARADLQ